MDTKKTDIVEDEKKDGKRTTLWSLFSAFFRIGILTFGGGYAMLPMLERECVEKYGWAPREELLDYYAIGQCTPGIIAVNVATFIGTKERGALGAAIATLGVITPSVIIILLIATLLNNFAELPVVIHAFAGIRCAVCVLMINAVIKLIRSNVKNIMGIVICIAAFLLTVIFNMTPVFPVLGAGIVGLGVGALKRGKDK